MTKGRGGGGAMRWAREAAVCGGQGGHGWLTPAAATKTTVSVDFYCSPRQSLHTNRWPCQGRRPEKQVNKGRTAVAAGGKDGRGCAGRASSGREEESSVVGGGGGELRGGALSALVPIGCNTGMDAPLAGCSRRERSRGAAAATPPYPPLSAAVSKGAFLPPRPPPPPLCRQLPLPPSHRW